MEEIGGLVTVFTQGKSLPAGMKAMKLLNVSVGTWDERKAGDNFLLFVFLADI